MRRLASLLTALTIRTAVGCAAHSPPAGQAVMVPPGGTPLCYAYCPIHGPLSRCSDNHPDLASVCAVHNVGQHDSIPVAKIYHCASTTWPCDDERTR